MIYNIIQNRIGLISFESNVKGRLINCKALPDLNCPINTNKMNITLSKITNSLILILFSNVFLHKNANIVSKNISLLAIKIGFKKANISKNKLIFYF